MSDETETSLKAAPLFWNRPLVRYALAAGAIAAAMLVRLALVPVIGAGTLYIVVYPVAFVVAVTLGAGPGAFSAALGIVLVEMFFVEPTGQLKWSVSLGVRASIVLLACFYVGRVNQLLRAARARADAQTAEARAAQQALREQMALIARAEAALRESENRYRSLFTSMKEGFFLAEVILDDAGKATDYRFLEVNPAHEAIVAKTRDEIVGRTAGELFPGLEDYWLETVGRVAQTGEPVRVEGFVEATGRYYENYYYSPRPGQFASIFSDVTDRKRAEEEVRQLNAELERRVEEVQTANESLKASRAAALDLMKDAVVARRDAEDASAKVRESEEILKRAQEIAHLGSWVFDLTKNELTWSDVAYRTFGLQPRQFAPTYEAFLDAVHPDDRAAVDAAYRDSVREGRDSYEIDHRIVRRNTGEVRWVHEKCAHAKDADGKIVRSEGMVLDITERKRAEETLRRSNENLSQFAYVASHDLQEPLRIMASFSQLLAKRYKAQLDSQANEFIGYIVDAANRMQKLISDLLVYSRIGRIDTVVQECDCNAVLDKLLRAMRPSIEKADAVVSHDGLPALRANENDLFRLFQNLIGNAVKFRRVEPPRVHIDAKRIGREWLFSVRDNGIGFDQRYKDRVFAVFQRLHGKDRYSGTGIGLSICKKIVETYGGRIWAESQPGEGSTFHFTLPAITEQETQHG